MCPQLCLMVPLSQAYKVNQRLTTPCLHPLGLQQRKGTVTFIVLSHREGSSGQSFPPSLACSIYLQRQEGKSLAGQLTSSSKPSLGFGLPCGCLLEIWILTLGTKQRGPTLKVRLDSQWVLTHTAVFQQQPLPKEPPIQLCVHSMGIQAQRELLLPPPAEPPGPGAGLAGEG